MENEMDIKNRGLKTSVIASTTIVFSLGLVATASAHQGKYVSDGSGNAVSDGSGNCVTAITGNDFDNCGIQAAGEIAKPPAPVVVPSPAPVNVAVIKPKPIIKPKPRPRPIVKTLSLNETGGANFAFDSDSVSQKGEDQLASFATMVNSSNIKPSTVSIVGHTDSIGSEGYNQKLSERRANSVAGFLSSKGMNRGVMQVSGRGESQPVASNKSKAGRAQNRRVDIRVTGQRTVTVSQ